MKPQTKPQLQSTDKYHLFDYNEEQREIKDYHVKNLMASMSKYGYSPSKPIQVYRKGSRFVIVDGHNRFVAAKNLGISFYYVTEGEDAQEFIATGNYVVCSWRVGDFAKMFAVRGIKDYATLIEYHQQGIPLTNAASMLMGKQSQDGGGRAGGASLSIKDGSFRIKTRKKIDALVGFINKFKDRNDCVTTRVFVVAMDKIMDVDGLDMDQLTRRVESNLSSLKRCATNFQMLELIEEIYNYRSSIKVPLAFNASKAKAMK